MRLFTSKTPARKPARKLRAVTGGVFVAVALGLVGCLITPPWGTWETRSDGTHYAVLSNPGCTMNLVASFGVTPTDGDGGFRVSSLMFNTCDPGVLGNVSLTMSTSTNGTSWTNLPVVSDSADDGRALTIQATADGGPGGPTWFKVHAAGLASHNGHGYTTGADYGPFKIGPNYASWKNGGGAGGDGSVNTDAERKALLMDLNSSGWDAWGGVSPDDQDGLMTYIKARNNEDGVEEPISLDESEQPDGARPEPPVDGADLELDAEPRSIHSGTGIRKVKPNDGDWVTVRNLPKALMVGNAKRGWRVNLVSDHDKVRGVEHADNANWAYIPKDFHACAWIKWTKTENVPDYPAHGCPDSNQVAVNTFASLINCNLCGAGWSVKVACRYAEPGHTPYRVPMFRNRPPRGLITDSQLAPYALPDVSLLCDQRVWWRYVSEDGKWVAMWALAIRGDKTASKWGFVRLSDLQRKHDNPAHVKGNGLCGGVAPHVPGTATERGKSHRYKEHWPLVCTERKQPNAGAGL